MGERQRKLAQLLDSESYPLPIPKHADIELSPYIDSMYETYLKLGGIQARDLLKTRVGKWDTTFNGIAIELDEEQHFNRYRAATMSSSVYDLLPRFPLLQYESFCVSYENASLKKASRGNYWTTDNSKRQFGMANIEGDLTGGSSPRWKQRALYDFVKDLAPLIFGFNMVRIAIWDTLLVAEQPMTINNALKYGGRNVRSAIIDLIEQRSYSTLPPSS